MNYFFVCLCKVVFSFTNCAYLITTYNQHYLTIVLSVRNRIILNFSYALTGRNLVTIAKFNLFLYTQSRSRERGKPRYKGLGRKSEEEKEVLTFCTTSDFVEKARKNYALGSIE